MLVLSENVFSNYNTYLIECNEKLFLDVNLKFMFLGAKTQKSTEVNKMSPKKVSLVI